MLPGPPATLRATSSSCIEAHPVLLPKEEEDKVPQLMDSQGVKPSPHLHAKAPTNGGVILYLGYTEPLAPCNSPSTS